MPKPQAVYVIEQEGRAVKIGVSNDPTKRLQGLQSGNPALLKVAHVRETPEAAPAAAVEAAAHAILRAKRAAGEWFAVTPAEAIAAIEDAIQAIEEGRDPVAAPARQAMTEAELRAARDALGLSVSQMAVMLGVTPDQVRRMERMPTHASHRVINGTTERLVRAYLDGYRPADWPA